MSNNKQSELVNKIIIAANQIAKNSVYGSGNFIILNKASSEYFKLIDKIKNRKEKISKLLDE